MTKPNFLPEDITAEEFNKQYPVGSAFYFYTSKLVNIPLRVKVKAPAEVLSGSVYVRVFGSHYGVRVNHLTPAEGEIWTLDLPEKLDLAVSRGSLNRISADIQKLTTELEAGFEVLFENLKGCCCQGITKDGMAFGGKAVGWDFDSYFNIRIRLKNKTGRGEMVHLNELTIVESPMATQP